MNNKKQLQEEYTSFKSLIRDLVLITREDKLVFRGVSNLNQLNPKINRVSTSDGITDLSSKEFDLLYRFRKFALSYMNGNLDFLDIVAYAQHFGLPTRLIDWSRNPFVALFFACAFSRGNEPVYLFYTDLEDHTIINSNHSDSVGDYIMINKDFISEYSTFLDSLENIEGLMEAVESNNKYLLNLGIVNDSHVRKEGLIFYECNASNPRLIAQQGLFSIPVSIKNNESKEEILSKSNKTKIILTDLERNQLLSYLNNMNYNGIRLFPDIQSICLNIVNDTLNTR